MISILITRNLHTIYSPNHISDVPDIITTMATLYVHVLSEQDLCRTIIVMS